MKTIAIIIMTIVLGIFLRDINLSLKYLVTKTDKVEVVEKIPVYYNNVKINGDCALVDPPCFEDFYHNVIRLKYE